MTPSRRQHQSLIDWMVAYPFQCCADGSGLMPCELLAGVTVDEHELDANEQRSRLALTSRPVPGRAGSLLNDTRRQRRL
jgi:hypothetical protein